MKIDEGTFRSILKNTQLSNNVWKKLNHPLRFCEYFHLRPTSGGITIVATLPYAPMRGLEVKGEEVLRKTLTDLLKELKGLCSDNSGKAAQKLEEFGFDRRNIDNAF